MDYYKMELITLLICVIPVFVTTITVTSNGNSPDIKMKGGMMVDAQEPLIAMASDIKEIPLKLSKIESKKISDNSTRLSINERYRRLIPYMTFYYANDLAVPTGNEGELEVQKAEIIESGEINDNRQPKKVIYSNQNIPRYQGNRLTQHNIASANPTKLFYQNVPWHHNSGKISTNINPPSQEYSIFVPSDYESGRVIHKPIPKYAHVPYVTTTRKPFLSFYDDDTPNIRYYWSEKEQSPKYKLVPYQQTPPVKILENLPIYETPKKPIPVPVLTTKEHIYIKPRPVRPQYQYEEINNNPQPVFRKPPVTVPENYYEKPRQALSQPMTVNGFKPLLNPPMYAQEDIPYKSSVLHRFHSRIPHPKQRGPTRPLVAVEDLQPNYYQYVVEESTPTPQPLPEKSTQLVSLLNSIQLSKSIPKPLSKGNVGSSITNLLQALNALKAVPLSQVEVPLLSTPKPFVAHKVVEDNTAPIVEIEPASEPPQTVSDDDLHEEPYLAHVNTPSQYLDEIPSGGGTKQQFPPPVTSDDEGGTPGRPGVDYPILTVIPSTNFNCKTQRYKGFFADPETRCQVWHYCDLNGGQASFLCPNGTIFSQAGLTCDWWFNVRCASTTQLYVLNESLYKYILPHTPKFPEDYSGPLVDKYLTLKFKEMEEQFKKNKNKQSMSEKMGSDETDLVDSEEDSSEKNDSNEEGQDTDRHKVDENASDAPTVIVESPGTSGNVERLHE